MLLMQAINYVAKVKKIGGGVKDSAPLHPRLRRGRKDLYFISGVLAGSLK